MKTKVCKKCKTEKSLLEFYKRSGTSDGLTSWCKECRKEYQKEYQKNNSEHQKEYKKEYNQKPEVKKRKRERSKKWYQKHREEKIKRSKEYYKNNPEKCRKNNKEWHKENLEYRREYEKEYKRNRRANNPRLRLNDSMATAIGLALKGNKVGRKWESLVGYTLKELIIHLESQFDNLMSWNNYGSYWWIDHYKPQSLFNFKTAEDKKFQKCWALSNLQPLEKIANIKKSNSYIIQ